MVLMIGPDGIVVSHCSPGSPGMMIARSHTYPYPAVTLMGIGYL